MLGRLERLERVRELTGIGPTGEVGQGITAADTTAGFRPDGLGALVNSSRGIIGAFRPENAAWEKAIENATRETIAALAEATPSIRS